MAFSLHHVGVAVEDIEQASASYVRLYGYAIESAVIEDPVQTARVRFLRLPGEASYLELVTPLGPASKLHGALSSGRRLNHLCYAVPELEAACATLRGSGLFLLQGPVEAAAFRPRRIAWLMGKDGIPVELVEQGVDRFARG